MGQDHGKHECRFPTFWVCWGIIDDQTGLVRFGARDYDAATGRWTTKDPIGFGGGSLNLYSYVDADPVSRFDPTGLGFWLAWHRVVPLPHYHSLIWWQPGDTFDPSAPHVTFGAGPDGICIGGMRRYCLNADWNRERDYNQPDRERMELTLPCGVSDDEMLERLFNLQAYYVENWNDVVRYEWQTTSNSYAHGLALAGGFAMPASLPGAVPDQGWDTPLPLGFFVR